MSVCTVNICSGLENFSSPHAAECHDSPSGAPGNHKIHFCTHKSKINKRHYGKTGRRWHADYFAFLGVVYFFLAASLSRGRERGAFAYEKWGKAVEWLSTRRRRLAKKLCDGEKWVMDPQLFVNAACIYSKCIHNFQRIWRGAARGFSSTRAPRIIYMYGGARK